MLNREDSSYVAVQIINEASFVREHLVEAIQNIRYEVTRPSILYKPKLSRDGNQYCFLLGDNIIEGCAGFGDTPELAAQDFDKNWRVK